MRRCFLVSFVVLLLAAPAFAARAQPPAYDVVVYGGASAAVTAAVQAKKLGKSVVVSPDKHLGGLHDCLSQIETPESVGMGSYAIDSHNVQRIVTKEGYVRNEGDIGIHPPKPYRIVYGAFIPKAEECTSLIVPVCVSSWSRMGRYWNRAAGCGLRATGHTKKQASSSK